MNDVHLINICNQLERNNVIDHSLWGIFCNISFIFLSQVKFKVQTKVTILKLQVFKNSIIICNNYKNFVYLKNRIIKLQKIIDYFCWELLLERIRTLAIAEPHYAKLKQNVGKIFIWGIRHARQPNSGYRYRGYWNGPGRGAFARIP
jgi:hypothetical protein